MKVEHHTHMAEYPIVVRMSKKEFEVLKEAVKYGAAWLDENGYSVESAYCCEMNEIFAKEPEVHGVPEEVKTRFKEDSKKSIQGFDEWLDGFLEKKRSESTTPERTALLDYIISERAKNKKKQ